MDGWLAEFGHALEQARVHAGRARQARAVGARRVRTDDVGRFVERRRRGYVIAVIVVDGVHRVGWHLGELGRLWICLMLLVVVMRLGVLV